MMLLNIDIATNVKLTNDNFDIIFSRQNFPPTFGQFPDIPLTTSKFPTFPRFQKSGQLATVKYVIRCTYSALTYRSFSLYIVHASGGFPLEFSGETSFCTLNADIICRNHTATSQQNKLDSVKPVNLSTFSFATIAGRRRLF